MNENISERTFETADTIRPQLPEIARLFIAAFTSPPRNELWTEESAQSFILEHLELGGWSSCRFNSTGSLIAFSLCVALNQWKSVSSIVKLTPDEQPCLYFSTLVTEPSFRRRGFGKMILLQDLMKAKSLGYRSVLARTRTDTPEIIGLLTQLEFETSGHYIGTIGGITAERLIHLKHIQGPTQHE